MNLLYKTDIVPTPEEVIELYNNSESPRPTDDIIRIKKMFDNSNLIVTAWHKDLLIGVPRCITDQAWSCYLADLAVRVEYQKLGIGRKLIKHTRETVGEQAMVLLLSVPTAKDDYPKIGSTNLDNAFIINREK